ncbi:MAG TPA: hypothetical protein VMN82_10280, partial [Thermoanaerobaculia bacterium]|nr:hypothetical protein [Thermoanaerobaculia bacterium]
MAPPRTRCARALAGAFLFAAAAAAARADRLKLAAERPDGACPAESKLPGIARLDAPPPEGTTGAGCLLRVRLDALADADVDAAVDRLARVRGAAGLVLTLPDTDDAERFAYAVKRLSSIFRSGSPDGAVALEAARPPEPALEEALAAYVDALVVRPGTAAPAESALRTWVFTAPSASASPTVAALSALERSPQSTLAGVLAGDRPLTPGEVDTLTRLASYFTADTSRDPTATRISRRDGSKIAALRLFDAKKFTPVLLLPEDPAGAVSIELSGGPFQAASVENLASGARRDFDVKGAPTLTLDLSKGPLAVVLQPMAKK